MPRLTAVDVLKKLLAKVGIKPGKVEAVESALADETLHYSRTGAETMTRRIAQRISDLGGTVLLGREAVRVEQQDGRVRSVVAKNSQTGAEEHYECDYCISTMPLPWLTQRLTGVTDEVKASADKLRYKGITIHGLLVNKEKCIDGLYIYYRECIFHRVGEPKNAGLRVTPANHSVLIVETTCEQGDEKWRATDEIRQRIIADLEKENICTRDQIVEWNVLPHAHGYPVFRLGFEEHFNKVKEFLATIPNLRSVGRQGGFTYPNMHSAMRTGAKTAEAILEMIAKDNSPA
jgi:protoporphyrinogen oxidase